MANALPALGIRLVQHQGQLVLVLEHRCGGGRKPAAVRLTSPWLERMRNLVAALAQAEQLALPNFKRVSRRKGKEGRGNWYR